MPTKITLNEGLVPVEVYTNKLETRARDQLVNLSRLPFVHHHVAAMPDVHAGRGATVGTVIATRRAIIPAAVGVDIGCGMLAVQTSLTAKDLPDNLRGLRSALERDIPVGPNKHKEVSLSAATLQPLAMRLDHIATQHRGIKKMLRQFDRTWAQQLGTLGGGNHFIELCLDQENKLWVMLHSGSRGIGNVLGRYFIELARKDMGRQLYQLPDQDLAYLQEGSEHFDDYMLAVDWAQDYAATNRREMLRLILRVMKRRLPTFKLRNRAINCHHNYVNYEHHFGQEVWITRKGAVSAALDELGIIPGSMGAKSYIVRGKGNANSFQSSAHGAGRQMSRTQAKRTFNAADLARQTAGVECRKDKGVVDEAPGAYKDIDEVMLHQADLVDVVHTLKQILCIKG